MSGIWGYFFELFPVKTTEGNIPFKTKIFNCFKNIYEKSKLILFIFAPDNHFISLEK